MAVRVVLIPLDGSESSQNIVQVLRTYISPESVRLVLLRSSTQWAANLSEDGEGVPNPSDEVLDSIDSAKAVAAVTESLDSEQGELLCTIQEQLSKQVESLRSAGYTVTGEVRFGDSAQQIIQYVNETQVSLIAMISPSRNGADAEAMDSVADRLIRSASVPVLFIRMVGQP